MLGAFEVLVHGAFAYCVSSGRIHRAHHLQSVVTFIRDFDRCTSVRTLPPLRINAPSVGTAVLSNRRHMRLQSHHHHRVGAILRHTIIGQRPPRAQLARSQPCAPLDGPWRFHPRRPTTRVRDRGCRRAIIIAPARSLSGQAASFPRPSDSDLPHSRRADESTIDVLGASGDVPPIYRAEASRRPVSSLLVRPTPT